MIRFFWCWLFHRPIHSNTIGRWSYWQCKKGHWQVWRERY